MKKTNLLRLSTILLAGSILLVACGSVKESNAPAQTVAPTKTYPAPTNTQIVLASDTPTIAPVATTASPLVQATSTLDKAHYISETYPDGSSVAPGASFDKTWRLQNAGATTWTTDYTLAYITSSPANEKLGSPDTIRLSQAVKPGENIDITVKLSAPQTTGSYKVTWRLLNPQGQIVSVDGYDLWALINVGNAQVSSSSGGSVLQSVTASGITVDLIEATYGGQSSSIKYCITLPDDANWAPQDMWVNANGQTTSAGFALAGSKQDPATFAAYRCYITTTESAIKTGESFSFSIGLIGKDGLSDEDCPLAQQALASQYPDLKFTCLPVTAGAFYTLIQRPKGMSDQEVDRIIVDAIQKNIYGPWSFNITR